MIQTTRDSLEKGVDERVLNDWAVLQESVSEAKQDGVVREWWSGSTRPHRLLATVNGMLRCIADAQRHVESLRDEAVRLQAVLCAESEKDSNDVKGGESELSRNEECSEVFLREPD